ncbi:MAG: hypothetical protein ACI32B_03350 [Erysipelotrichaceae bacterium]
MIKISNVKVNGFEDAIRGMRNPMNSWHLSDSRYISNTDTYCAYEDIVEVGHYTSFVIGQKDKELMMKLCKAGPEHRKFMRMITVHLDITAPFYWWKEFDTYKVGTVANSCSTMHKLTEKEFELKDFSTEHLTTGFIEDVMMPLINVLNNARSAYTNYEVYKSLDESTMKDGLLSQKDIWWQMIQLLPCSYNQKRTVMMNYEVLANIYRTRKGHKLDEWLKLCEWIETLPCAWLFTGKHDE